MTSALHAAAAAAVTAQAPTKDLTGWQAYLTPDNVMTLITAVVAAAIAAAVAVTAYKKQQKETRQQERARLYADAVRVGEDYLEAPYRIRRRDGSASARRDLTESVSEIKSRISFYTAWLSINAPSDVYDAYRAYIAAAQKEAGAQMTRAWTDHPTRRDKDVPIGHPLPRHETDLAREAVLASMKSSLSK